MTQRFDVVIIGGGNAGFGVSAVAAQAGKSIAFVESRDFGGVCPNRGCTPKKVLVAAAHALHEIEIAPVHGIEIGEARLDWAKLIDREKAMVASIPEKMRGLAAKRGTVFEGRAAFVSPNAVEVGGAVIEGEHLVIATGSKPRPLPIEGAGHLVTSDEVLSERALPREVVFVGGGVIAMEFGHVYVRAGAKVTILEVMPRLLPALDADAVGSDRLLGAVVAIAHAQAAAGLDDLGDLDAGPDGDPDALAGGRQRRHGVGVQIGQNPRHGLQDRHLGARPCIDVAELHGDHAAADEHHLAGLRALVEHGI